MPERENPFKESDEANLPDKAPDKREEQNEAYKAREEKPPPAPEGKPTLPIPREGTGLSSVDVRQPSTNKTDPF